MTQLIRTITTLLASAALFVGILFSTNGVQAMAAVTPQGAKEIIEQSSSVQDAGEKLKALDSSEKVRNHQTLDTTKDVYRADNEQTFVNNRRDESIRDTGNKLKDIAETVKEKLNLDEPIPDSTKEFINDVENAVDNTVGKVSGEKPGYYKAD
ncbi:hypothetical protein ACKFKG_15915 [Phormidesmis sp. 146-35]